jgi:uncharacterized protein YbjT (DUF2867 family)
VTKSRPIAIAGASGYIGGLLARELRGRGAEVRALARRPERAPELAEIGCELYRADVLEPATLADALDGVGVAYYLVHSMGRGAGAGFAERDLRGASNFAAAAKRAGVGRIVYLGGLGEGTKHLDSRHATAARLGETGVPVTYLRAAAVIGAGSESFRTVLYLVRRLPLMVTPRWTETRTQPIAVIDVIAYLAQAGELDALAGQEVQIGGPDVITYAGMMDKLAEAMDVRAPLKIRVPALTPWLSSLWIGLVTPVDVGVARPLIEGLSTETVVTDPSGMASFDVEPTPIETAMHDALAELEA